MKNVLIFGHKNPDTDSIVSSLVMENFEKKLGNTNVQACRLGVVNKETQFVLDYLGGIEPPTLIDDVEDGQEIILVDHANPGESVPNLNNAKILKIVDHHQVLLNTSYPLFYRAEPLGCTQSIMYKLYKEYGVEIDKKIATLMVSAIISDTLLFKSPTCTEQDKKIAMELARIAEIDIETYGLDMLKAGTDLSSFSIEEILSIDAKAIDLKGTNSIIAQVNTASIEDVMQMKAQLEEGIEKIIKEKNLDLFLLLITDIINSNSQIISLGKSAKIVEKAYGITLENNTALLKGVVSRKKQVVPILTENA